MAEKQVIFQINVNGNAAAQLKKISATAEQTKTKFEKLGDFSLRLNNIYAPAEVVISNTASPRCPAKRTYSSRPRWAATWCWAPK